MQTPGARAVTSARLFAVAAAMVVIPVLASAEQDQPSQQHDRNRVRRPRQATLKVGQAAPDFELPMLSGARDRKGEQVWRLTETKVKLSSFRGKKLVCVFFSSYT